MLNNKILIVTLVVAAFVSSYGLSLAEMWEPYQFEPKDQEYEYEITNYEGTTPEGEPEAQVSYYLLKITEKNDNQLEVSVQTTWMAGQEELGSEILGGWWAAGAFGLTMAFINPMYAAFFGGLDLHVGNKMSFFGAGVVQVTGTETVAGREGFVCELLNEDGGAVQGRYVVDPSVPLPLRAEMFKEDGTKQFQTELQRIEM